MLKLPGGSKRQDAWETAAKRECDSATFESWEISWYIGKWAKWLARACHPRPSRSSHANLLLWGYVNPLFVGTLASIFVCITIIFLDFARRDFQESLEDVGLVN